MCGRFPGRLQLERILEGPQRRPPRRTPARPTPPRSRRSVPKVEGRQSTLTVTQRPRCNWCCVARAPLFFGGAAVWPPGGRPPCHPPSLAPASSRVSLVALTRHLVWTRGLGFPAGDASPTTAGTTAPETTRMDGTAFTGAVTAARRADCGLHHKRHWAVIYAGT